jgi:hypothetical protein
VLDHFQREASPNGHWNWYAHDWRGKRGDSPRPAQVVESIYGAVRWKPGKPQPAAEPVVWSQ